MPPPKSEQPVGRAGAKPRRESREEEAPPAPQLKLGCGPLLVAIGIIALLGTLLPHESQRSETERRASAAPASSAPAKAATQATAKAEPPKPAPVPTRKPPASPPQPPASRETRPAPREARPATAKAPDKPAKREHAAVFNDPWTGSVSQVERYLKRTLYDAASFEALEWGPVATTARGYRVRCTYRAKNLLGVYATQTKHFLLDRSGEVYAVQD